MPHRQVNFRAKSKMERKYIENLEYQGIGEVAGVYREERIGVAPKKRVNPFEMNRIEGKVNFEYDPDDEFYEQEKKGLDNIFELASDGFGLIFWFSPPGGHYPEGRVVVARVAKIEGENVWLECRGLVSTETGRKMKSQAEKIIKNGGVSMDGIETAEDLRSQPVGIKTDKHWCDFGEEMLGMSEVWEAIRSGEDVKEKKVIEKQIFEIRKELLRKGEINNIRLFEQMMAVAGYRLNPLGNHGGANYQTIQGGLFNRMFNSEMVMINGHKDKRLEYCDGCGVYYIKKKGRCPRCGRGQGGN